MGDGNPKCQQRPQRFASLTLQDSIVLRAMAERTSVRWTFMSVAWPSDTVEAKVIVAGQLFGYAMLLGQYLGHECPGYVNRSYAPVELKRMKPLLELGGGPQRFELRIYGKVVSPYAISKPG